MGLVTPKTRTTSPDPRKLGCAHKGLGSRGWGWDGKVCVVGREMGLGDELWRGCVVGGRYWVYVAALPDTRVTRALNIVPCGLLVLP